MTINYQIQTKNTTTNEKAVFQSVFTSFFETQLWDIALTQHLVRLLADLPKGEKMIVSTVCENDKPNTFEYSDGWVENGVKYVLTNQSEHFKNKLTKEHKDYIEHNTTDDVKTGYIVCDKTRQYIDIAFFTERSNKAWQKNRILALSPISLLTRSDKYTQGGGDFDIEYNRYHTENSNVNLVTSWKDCEIHYSETAPQDYTNISEGILFI